MGECKECIYGLYRPIQDKQIRPGSSRIKGIDNWDCEHPDNSIKKRSEKKGGAENCPGFKAK